MSNINFNSLAQNLLDFGRTIEPADLFPVVEANAYGQVVNDPYSFCIATCLDRGKKAEIIWTIPYDMKKELGHLDPYIIRKMSRHELSKLLHRLPHRPRYINDAPRTIEDLTRIVVDEYNGDPSKIWLGKSAREVVRIFDSIFGVGRGIANMSVLLIEKAFRLSFDDRPFMDIKPDTHTILVLYRLGVSGAMTEDAAIEAARRLDPKCPGELDGALWIIGRRWCHPMNPDCLSCPENDVCVKRGLRKQTSLLPWAVNVK